MKTDLSRLAETLYGTCGDGMAVNFRDGAALPDRRSVIYCTESLLEILFPGFSGEMVRKSSDFISDTAVLLGQVGETLSGLIGSALRCRGKGSGSISAEDALDTLFRSLPDLRNVLKDDVRAGYTGDPAATGTDEVVLCYPALQAIAIQRIAHVLWLSGIPLIPRMMTEYAHSRTGIDIHPGATIGRGFFIDHGTGVVIGETAVIGDNVRIYQGVTLGAVSFPKDACGLLIKGNKRHPTIGNNVIIYSGASVLGDITIGDNSIIGGNVWLTESLPPGTKITSRPPEHNLKYSGGK